VDCWHPALLASDQSTSCSCNHSTAYTLDSGYTPLSVAKLQPSMPASTLHRRDPTSSMTRRSFGKLVDPFQGPPIWPFIQADSIRKASQFRLFRLSPGTLG
jgi:hypothetical protein